MIYLVATPYRNVNIYYNQGQLNFVTLFALKPKLYNLRCVI